MMEDAEVCIVSCGITARVSRNAIVEARKRGIKAGMIRPITLWPFPDKPLLAAADKVKGFVCVELQYGPDEAGCGAGRPLQKARFALPPRRRYDPHPG